MELAIEIIRLSIYASTPVLLAALGGLFTWHANVFNISMEGMLLTSAFAAIVGSYFFGSWIVGIIFGIVGSLLISALFGFFVFKMKTGEFITGIAINTFVLGFTTYLLRAIFNVKGTLINARIQGIPNINIPIIENIPILGRLLSGHSVVVYLTLLVIVPLCYFTLYKTPFGLRLRASGFDNKVVDSLGIKSQNLGMKSILICGLLSGLGGSFLSLGYMRMFSENMSNGRGWISLATIIVSKGNPVVVLIVSFIFGLMEGSGLILQKYNIPSQITSMLPYVAVLIVLFFNSRVKAKKVN